MAEKYYPPTFKADAFHCPHCGVYSHQSWAEGAKHDSHWNRLTFRKTLRVSTCQRCKDYSLWVENNMIYPINTIAPLPEENMPDDVEADFLEARNVVNSSPRAAAALLRLGIQKLMVHLEEDGKNINDNIGNLVKKGLPVGVQQALDTVRVVGNNAVHPGELDLKDDIDTTLTLFKLVNMIVRVMISQPEEIKAIYGTIPKRAQDAIKKRDKTP